ncbi:FMR1-interacting protein NUFIP2 [Bombina bombina]|uniref:FMR1-interacting protein NUFIP2 n=1 Tax=Bombina bombina TaxID=8345 RepID=UPI00235A622A|nr:FMR1-interacting protein NUFIP2 [Bombina bombina]
MHKENQAQDENSNPREGPGRGKKDKLNPSELDMNHLNKSRAKTGTWDSNGFGPDPEIESLAGRTEESVPLSPSNSLNLRHLRNCERDSSGRQHQRSPTTQYHPNQYSHHYHHHYRPFYRKGYWDYESQYRDGKRKEWVPRPNGGGRTQRPRHREALNSADGSCGDGRKDQTTIDKGKAGQTAVVSRQPSPPVKDEQATDSWSLFKPLPVFPVDSSSARTLPKISYASKVKENLDNKGLVPSSALRTSNGLPNCLQNTNTADPHTDSPSPAPVPTTGSLSSSCSSLSSTPPSPVSQENLGAIFQNEWGLSFINEPGAGQAEVKGSEEEKMGREEIGGGGDNSTEVLGRLCLHGFFVEGEESEENTNSRKDLEAMVTYSTQEWDRVWNQHKKDPSRVVLYTEILDGKG